MDTFPLKPYPWQRQQWQQLQRYRQTDKIPHALLFSGLEGLGKFHLANVFAQSLLCEAPQEDGLNCGTCKNCLLIKAGNHPDYFIIQAEENSKTIKVGQIRELIESMTQTSHSGLFRTIIVQPAEAMNAAAANALLKNLEEPNKDTLIILISHQAASLPATIRSRCQSFIFNLPNQSMATEWLQKALSKQKFDADSQLLLALTEGAPLRAFALADSEQLQTRDEILQGLIALSSQQIDPIKFASSYVNTDALVILNCVISWVMDIIRLASGQSADSLMNQDCVVHLEKQSQTVSLNKLYLYLDELMATRNECRRNINLNQQLLLEKLFIAWFQLMRS